jgi:hypothetical protein
MPILRLLQYIISGRSPSVVPHLTSLYARIDAPDCKTLGNAFCENCHSYFVKISHLVLDSKRENSDRIAIS